MTSTPKIKNKLLLPAGKYNNTIPAPAITLTQGLCASDMAGVYGP